MSESEVQTTFLPATNRTFFVIMLGTNKLLSRILQLLSQRHRINYNNTQSKQVTNSLIFRKPRRLYTKKFLLSPELNPISKSCPSLASESNAWHTGFELLKCNDFIGSCTQIPHNPLHKIPKIPKKQKPNCPNPTKKTKHIPKNTKFTLSGELRSLI